MNCVTHTRPKKEREATPFEAYLAVVRRAVDGELARMLREKEEGAQREGEPAHAAFAAMAKLAVRGGKRQRAALLAAAYEACGGVGGSTAVTAAGVAIELLQTYFLVHDDWMDASELRRSGPTVHVALRATFASERHADAAAILAGDWACALAQEALLSLPYLPPEAILAALRELARIQSDVIVGQLLDVHGATDAIDRMHELKTGSYTVRGPFELGALLAGASTEQHAFLERFAKPLGIAFQLRDDLLGTFGDPLLTGKSVTSDIAERKRTALVADLLETANGRAVWSSGEPDAIRSFMIESGTKTRVEARLARLVDEACSALATSPLTADGKVLLASAARLLAQRDR